MQPAGNLVFRNTASKKGRNLSVTPRTSAMQKLHYGRIILDSEMPLVRFETEGREVGLICLSGASGHAINFVWLMAAHREREDRKMGVVNVEPAFAASGSGLEAATR